jgi:hypothetical protein
MKCAVSAFHFLLSVSLQTIERMIPVQTESRLPTPNASTYIRQLCKHFAHKVTATYTETQGHVQFDGGSCEMIAEPETLIFRIHTDDAERIPMLQSVIDRHLEKFAVRETLPIGNWQVPVE